MPDVITQHLNWLKVMSLIGSLYQFHPGSSWNTAKCVCVEDTTASNLHIHRKACLCQPQSQLYSYLLPPDPFTVKMLLSESITLTSDAMYLELLAIQSKQWSMVVCGRPCRYSGTKSL